MCDNQSIGVQKITWVYVTMLDDMCNSASKYTHVALGAGGWNSTREVSNAVYFVDISKC